MTPCGRLSCTWTAKYEDHRRSKEARTSFQTWTRWNPAADPLKFYLASWFEFQSIVWVKSGPFYVPYRLTLVHPMLDVMRCSGPRVCHVFVCFAHSAAETSHWQYGQTNVFGWRQSFQNENWHEDACRPFKNKGFQANCEAIRNALLKLSKLRKSIKYSCSSFVFFCRLNGFCSHCFWVAPDAFRGGQLSKSIRSCGWMFLLSMSQPSFCKLKQERNVVCNLLHPHHGPTPESAWHVSFPGLFYCFLTLHLPQQVLGL